jgi:hypothetical protein
VGDVPESDAAGIRRLAQSEVVRNWHGAVDCGRCSSPYSDT